MRLEFPDDPPVENPDAEAIREALTRAAAGEIEFVILAASEMTYLQVAGGADGLSDLEYQDGSPEQHYTARDERLDLDNVIAGFVAYAGGAPEWKDRFVWEPEQSGGCLGLVICAVGAVTGLAGAAAAILLLALAA
ncbi:MAG: hypothetical protein ACOCX4_03840 [Planctomycetota bacterium]